MASSGVFYLIELETDGWGWWSKQLPGNLVQNSVGKWVREGPLEGWIYPPRIKKWWHTKKWAGKERFLKAGISTTRYHKKCGDQVDPRPDIFDSYKHRLGNYERENIKVLNELYHFEVEPYTLNPDFQSNHRKVELMFMEEFKDKFDYSPMICFSGRSECFTIDLKKEKKMLDNFVEKVQKEFV